MPLKSFKIFLNGKEFLKKKFDNNSSLSEIRERIKDKLDSDFNFLDSENFFIDKEDEDGTTIEELKTDDSIKIQLTEKNIELKKEIEYNIKPKNIPIEGSNPLKNEGELKIYKYPIVEFTSTEEAKACVMLVVGETGSGKTSFINAFVNYLMGIDVSDDFRYKLIIEEERKKSESQTKGLHIYNIRSKKMLIKIADTQGYGDTNGVKEDEAITMKIKDAFMNELNSINIICFVVKSSDTRLTSHQNYIFSSVISLFGNDIKKNFITLFTFYDGSKPSAIITLENSTFKDVISSIDNPWYLNFNNKLYYQIPEKDDDGSNFKKLQNNFKLLSEKIESLPRLSLQQSKDNLTLRERISMSCKALEELLTRQLDIMVQKREQIKYIKENEMAINQNKIKLIPRKRIEFEKEELKNGNKATICKICKFNCHSPCMDTSINGVDVLFFTCKIWSWGLNCTICPNHCPSSVHELSSFNYVKKEYTDYVSVENILEIKDNINGVNIAKKLLDKLQKEEKEIKQKIEITQSEIKKKYSELKKIALNITSYQTTIEFLEERIKEEERTKDDGYKERIELYQNMIEENKHVLKCSEIE